MFFFRSSCSARSAPGHRGHRWQLLHCRGVKSLWPLPALSCLLGGQRGDRLQIVAPTLFPETARQIPPRPFQNADRQRDSATYNVGEMMETEPAYADFISCDRTGRRNAVHDLPGDAAAIKLEKPANTMDISVADEENQAKEAAFEKNPGLIPERKNDSSTF